MKENFIKLSQPQKLEVLCSAVKINREAFIEWAVEMQEPFAEEMEDRDLEIDLPSTIQKAYQFLQECSEANFYPEFIEEAAENLEELQENLGEFKFWLEGSFEDLEYIKREFAALDSLVSLLDLLTELSNEELDADEEEEMADQMYLILFMAIIGLGNTAIPTSAVPSIGLESNNFYVTRWNWFDKYETESEKIHNQHLIPFLTTQLKELNNR